MASGNTFGATALSSYGGFWIALGINFTPGGFNTQAILEQADSGKSDMFFNSMGLFVFVSQFQISLADYPADIHRAGSSSPSSCSCAH